MSSIEAANPDDNCSSNNAVKPQRTLRIPKGFQALLESFAREVLRSQPTDIYSFGAEYFDRMVQFRTRGPAETDVAQADSSTEEQQVAATVTETAAHIEEENGADIPAETLAESQKPIMSKQEDVSSSQQKPGPMTSSGVGDEEPIDIDLNDPDVQAAAAKIQKGWGNRRAAAAAATKGQQEPPPPPPTEAKAVEEEEVVDIDLNDPEVQAAAVKIQKGWGTRKLAAKQQTPQ